MFFSLGEATSLGEGKLWIQTCQTLLTKLTLIKWDFFQAVIVSILLYGCITWRLKKCMEKKLDENYTRILCAVLNKSWKQNPTKQQLYGHLPPISQTIQVRWVRHIGHCWRSKDKLISDILLWTPTHGQTSIGQSAGTDISSDMGCGLEDLPRTMGDTPFWNSVLSAWLDDI